MSTILQRSEALTASRATIKTMADLILKAQGDAGLIGRKARDVTWALRTVSRAFGKTPEEMPADARTLSQKLEGFAAAQAGLADSTWKNALSLTRFAFARYGITKTPLRKIERFAPEWTRLLALMGSGEHDQIGLSRLARFGTTNGIKPEDVNDAVFDAFLEDITHNAVLKNPRKLHRRAAIIWNKMVQTTRHWPNQTVTVPSYSKVYFVGWDRFPASLEADIDKHLEAISGNDVLAVLDAKPLKPRSIKARRHHLGAYLSALVLEGEDPASLRTLQDAFTEARIRIGLKFFIARGKKGSTAQAHDIARTLLAVGRHYVGIGEQLDEQMKKFCKRLDQDADGISEKNRVRLRQFDNPNAVRALLGLPKELAAAAKCDGRPTREQALLMQTAVAIEILLMVPMRRGNLANLNLILHLDRSQKGSVPLFIPGHEVKNGVEIVATFSGQTVKLLDLYVAKFRPVLLEEPSDWLFPGLTDRPKSSERMATQISETIKRRLGLLMNVHLFRHLSAKLILESHRGAYGTVRFLHGHKSVQTTMRHYMSLETKNVVQQYDDMILKLRGDTAKDNDDGEKH